MHRFSILEAPSILGLRPTGVEDLPAALEAAGLRAGLNAEHAGRVEPPPYDPERDSETLLLNPGGLRTYALELAEAVSRVLRRERFPVVLGGDCSNLLGVMLTLRRMGRYGLFFIDGHADFYQPAAEPSGEAASMDLAIVSGRGPEILTDLAGLKPLVRDEDIVAFGYRDAEQQREYGSQDIQETAIHTFPLDQVRAAGVANAARRALDALRIDQLSGFWIHLDADVLDDAIMPAVDYRLPGGLSWDELTALLKILVESGAAAGLNVGIFNPRLDPDGSISRRFVTALVEGLAS
jgi:arginase